MNRRSTLEAGVLSCLVAEVCACCVCVCVCVCLVSVRGRAWACLGVLDAWVPVSARGCTWRVWVRLGSCMCVGGV